MPPKDKVAPQDFHFLQAAFDLAVTATAIVALDGSLLKANGAFCDLIGDREAELTGRAYADLIHRDDHTSFVESLGRAQQGAATNFRLEHRYLGRNGREVWGRTSLALAHDAEGAPACFICQVLDVTERRDMEERLLRKRQRLTETERLARLGNWELDLADKRLRWSDEVSRIFEIPPARFDASCEDFLNIVHPDDRALVEQVYTDSVKNRTPYTVAHRLLFPDERIKHVIAYGETLYDASGQPFRSIGTVQDITERQQAESAMRESEQRYREIFENVSDALYLLEVCPDGRFRNLAINPAFERSVGMSQDELIGNYVDETVPAETAAAVIAKYRRCVEAATATEEEVDLDLPSGRRSYHSTLIPVRDTASGRIHRIVGIARDITERKRLESVLRAKDGYQRALLDNFPFMVWLKDTESRFLAVNQPFAEAAGQPSSDIFFGKTDLDFWPRDLAESYRADDREVLRLKQRKIVEELIADQGVRKYFETYKAPVEVDGELLGTVGFARDITTRKQMEEQLHASEQQFRNLAENSPNFIVRYDLDCRRTYANPAFEREIGFPTGQALGTPLETHWLSTTPVEEYKAKLRQVMETGMSLEMLSEWRRPDGSLISHAVNMAPEYGPDGQVVGVLSIGHNITALKNAERRLRESHGLLRGLASRLERGREEERKRIAREIHDELGQHLTALRMGISMLRFQFGQDNPLLAERVNDMMSLADKTIQVVRDVASSLRPAALDMGLSAALDWLVTEFFRHTNIDYQLNVPEEKIYLDDDRATAVFRVIQESLTNVVRHAEASRVDIVLESRSNEYRVEIRDNGKGFDPTLTGKASFGLVGMRERGLMLGGEVNIASAPGQGTVIRICIPIHDPMEEQ
ncbi:PAS domain S-box protein [Pseudogulbenkiania sp. MAI-1]|uniref:PAS domain S-box protein n=1 Tax=Pseudogulbenkiania sp. MAI-1 TaxID=990370 RepID=UPI00045EA2BA|nr:PAS domain S-box protein [Pseudogulbenkiania sp. MAI-1]